MKKFWIMIEVTDLTVNVIQLTGNRIIVIFYCQKSSNIQASLSNMLDTKWLRISDLNWLQNRPKLIRCWSIIFWTKFQACTESEEILVFYFYVVGVFCRRWILKFVQKTFVCFSFCYVKLKYICKVFLLNWCCAYVCLFCFCLLCCNSARFHYKLSVYKWIPDALLET
jgi:hypothetical protein